LAPIIEVIKDIGFAVDGHLISYFSYIENASVFVARDPLPADKVIPADSFTPEQRLVLKFKESKSSNNSAAAMNKNVQ